MIVQASVAAIPMIPIQYARMRIPFSGVGAVKPARRISPVIPAVRCGIQNQRIPWPDDSGVKDTPLYVMFVRLLMLNSKLRLTPGATLPVVKLLITMTESSELAMEKVWTIPTPTVQLLTKVMFNVLLTYGL